MEKPSVFGKRVLTPWASKTLKKVGHSTMLSRWHVFLTIFPSHELSQAFFLSYFYPVSIPDFGLYGVFPSVQNCHCCVHILCWPLHYLWVWKWGLSLLDKPCVCRSLTNKARGLDFFLLPLNSTGREGIARGTV